MGCAAAVRHGVRRPPWREAGQQHEGPGLSYPEVSLFTLHCSEEQAEAQRVAGPVPGLSCM